MTDIHVLQLIDGLNYGGAEVLLRDLTLGLIQRGYRVTVGFSTPGPLVDVLLQSGIQLTRLPRIGRIDPFLLSGMLRLMRKDPPQVVHTHLFKSDFHGRLAARFAGVPVVVSTLHNADAWARRWPFGMLYGQTARFADHVIAVSSEVKDYHVAHSGIPAGKIDIIDNGVDVRKYRGLQDAGKKVRAEFGFSDDAILFGIIARLKPQKDHVTFLNAAAEILKDLPGARFLVVGEGPLLAELEGLADQLGLRPALIFAGLRNDIPEILAALDVLVFSSRWEGLPVSLLEGMAASKPIAATAVDGIKGVADSCALLVPPGEPHALAAACKKLALDADLRSSLGQAGFERVANYYSLDAMIEKIAGIYNRLLRERGLGEHIPTTTISSGALR